MKSEFYVINLIRGDEDACRKVAESLGLAPSLKPANVIYEISQTNTLWSFMMRHNCNWQDTFVEIRRLLDGELEDADTLKDEDLNLILEAKGQKLLGELLVCPPTEALQSLFASEEIEKLLRETGIARRRDWLHSDSEWLLSVLLSNTSWTKLENAFGNVDLWNLLYELMREPRRQQLAQGLGCQEGEVLRVLVRRIKLSGLDMHLVGNPQKSAGAILLDAIALSKFRAQLHVYRYVLVEQSRSQAYSAKARLPGHELPRALPSLIAYYLCLEYKVALEDLFSTKQLLREMCNCEAISHLESAPREARLELVSTPSVGEGIDLTVRCYAESSDKQTEILRARGLQPEQVQHIRNHFPKTVGEISGSGTTLAERIQNTPLPPLSPWRAQIRAALSDPTNTEALDDTFVQSFVLSGASLHPDAVVPDLEFGRGSNHLTSSVARVQFPKSTPEIADSVRSKYQQHGRTVKAIKVVS